MLDEAEGGEATMTELQRFLRGGGSPESLFEKYAIKSTPHKTLSNLLLFKYHQIDSPFDEQIVRECRGIILNSTDDWAIVARPFDKFFNYGEGRATPIDWSTARVQEKLDGSLCNLYYYAGEWRIATSGMPDATGSVGDATDLTFADLFWSTFLDMRMTLPSVEHESKTFMFELTASENRVVVRQNERKLTLIGVRGRDGVEYQLEGYGYPVVQSFPLGSLEEVVATFSRLSPVDQEGYVVVDAAFHRIKVKHPGYVALHAMRDGMGGRRVLELIRFDTTDEVLSYFPEYHKLIDPILSKFNAMAKAIDEEYRQIQNIEAQKDFALRATKFPFSGGLFSIRAKKVATGLEYLRGLNVDALFRMLGLKSDE